MKLHYVHEVDAELSLINWQIITHFYKSFIYLFVYCFPNLEYKITANLNNENEQRRSQGDYSSDTMTLFMVFQFTFRKDTKIHVNALLIFCGGCKILIQHAEFPSQRYPVLVDTWTIFNDF